MSQVLAAKEIPSKGDAILSGLATAIAVHPFLQGMAPRYLDLLCACAMHTQFSEGHLIFREGELANRFYLIREGKVALESRINGGEVVPIQMLGQGDVLGWSWLFPPYYWHFDARVVEPTKAIFFYGARLRTECDDDHDLGYELIKRMEGVAIKRMQAAREQMLELSKRRRSGNGA